MVLFNPGQNLCQSVFFQLSALRFPFERVERAVGELVERSMLGGVGRGPFDGATSNCETF